MAKQVEQSVALWSCGYYVVIVGNMAEEVIKKYMQE